MIGMRNKMPLMALAALLAGFSVGAAGHTGQTLKSLHVPSMATITFAVADQNPAGAKANSPEGAHQGEAIYRAGMQALNNQQGRPRSRTLAGWQVCTENAVTRRSIGRHTLKTSKISWRMLLPRSRTLRILIRIADG
jgi:hypothetical protein